MGFAVTCNSKHPRSFQCTVLSNQFQRVLSDAKHTNLSVLESNGHRFIIQAVPVSLWYFVMSVSVYYTGASSGVRLFEHVISRHRQSRDISLQEKVSCQDTRLPKYKYIKSLLWHSWCMTCVSMLYQDTQRITDNYALERVACVAMCLLREWFLLHLLLISGWKTSWQSYIIDNLYCICG